MNKKGVGKGDQMWFSYLIIIIMTSYTLDLGVVRES